MMGRIRNKEIKLIAWDLKLIVMKRLIYNIKYWIPGVILGLLTMANAGAQIVVDQCDTMEFIVTGRPSIQQTHFVWGIYNSSSDPVDILDPATTLDPALYLVDGMYAGSTVKVVGLGPGTYYVRIHVWDEVACIDNIEVHELEVVPNEPELMLASDSVCIGEIPYIKIVFSGIGPYDAQLTYSYVDRTQTIFLNGEVDNEILYPITDPSPFGETEIWAMEISDGRVHSYLAPYPGKARVVIYSKPTNSQIYPRDK